MTSLFGYTFHLVISDNYFFFNKFGSKFPAPWFNDKLKHFYKALKFGSWLGSIISLLRGIKFKSRRESNVSPGQTVLGNNEAKHYCHIQKPQPKLTYNLWGRFLQNKSVFMEKVSKEDLQKQASKQAIQYFHCVTSLSLKML